MTTAARPLAAITAGWKLTKRDGRVADFDPQKVERALWKCLHAVSADPAASAEVLAAGGAEAAVAAAARQVVNRLARERPAGEPAPGVEDVQRLVIQQLWGLGLFAAAEHYQNYREERRKARALETAAVFGSRTAFKPFDYPDAAKFKDAIQRSPWTAHEFDFTSDTQDYRVRLLPAERAAVSRTMLAISQVEVAVKKFWARLGDRLPRPEFEQVGVVFGESEVRHADAYSKVLDALDLNAAFAGLSSVPAVRQRIDYLNRALRAAAGGADRAFAKTLATFALLVENVSLFSQFCIVKSFSRQKGLMQNVDNVVQATIKEEQVHAQFGVWLTNLIRAERPEWFDGDFYSALAVACREAYAAETAILDWIFEDGAISSVTKPALQEFLKARINTGVVQVGSDPVFAVDRPTLAETAWFDEELAAPIDVDFFHKRATNYCTPAQAVTAADLW